MRPAGLDLAFSQRHAFTMLAPSGSTHPPLQSFGKEPVFLGGVVGMGVDGIDQEFAFRQNGQPLAIFHQEQICQLQ